MAVRACLNNGDFVGAAESCEEEAKKLTGAPAEEQLQNAIKHYKKAKQHLLGFQLLQRHPHLAKNMTPEVCMLPEALSTLCCCTYTCCVIQL